MSFEERRKSLICLAKLICQCDEQKSQAALEACEAECAELKELLHAAKVGLWYRNEDRWSETTTALIESIELKLNPKPM